MRDWLRPNGQEAKEYNPEHDSRVKLTQAGRLMWPKEGERSKRRMLAGKPSGNLPEGSGDTRDKVAARLGISGRSRVIDGGSSWVSIPRGSRKPDDRAALNTRQRVSGTLRKLARAIPGRLRPATPAMGAQHLASTSRVRVSDEFGLGH